MTFLKTLFSKSSKFKILKSHFGKAKNLKLKN